MKSAGTDNFLMFVSYHTLRFSKLGFELLWRRLFGIDLLTSQIFRREKLRISSKQNVSTTAGHVRCDRDRSFAAGLCDDLGFALVILCVEHVMRNADLLQTIRDQLRIL